ncbi:uncharacterized protein DEA37_0011287 [Paragonimus westermani]|uniref:Reverse transcriptase RNase H-like domain-containing protein n=1 Tax=Paragonimus westermani TaxID=34504 RepID=A0A5J4NN95_9TREM|nr:uncharacterized protein DEA37_0011287 [Paragonimus westermani]
MQVGRLEVREPEEKVEQLMKAVEGLKTSVEPAGQQAKKADGTYRFCVDFRELKRVPIKDASPTSRMEDTFAHLHKAKILSLKDLRSGYWQLPMAQEDREAASIRRRLTIQKPNEPITVSVDASDIRIGAVLSQPSGTIEYTSRILTGADRKYSIKGEECLATVWALEKWKTCLIATTFPVETDHKPLIWLKTVKDRHGRLAR